MKTLFIILALSLAVSCTTPPCPPESLMFLGGSPVGPIPMIMQKGFFDNPENFMTRDEYNNLQRQPEVPQEPESETADLSRKGEK